MKKALLFLFGFILSNCILAQKQDTIVDWPYKMPIFGKKAAERGYKPLLPYGLNINYINTKMELDVTEFSLTIGDNPALNDILLEYVNKETLNFNSTTAFANGINLRPDVFIFPFLNVYGVIAITKGYTEVNLQPTWYDDFGDLLLQLPVINSRVEFNAYSYGAGATMFYGIKNIFVSGDFNFTSTSSEILDKSANIITASGRAGYRFLVSQNKPDMSFALYVGIMYRNFLNPGSQGRVTLDQALPELQDNLQATLNDRRVEIQDIAIPELNSQLAQLQDDYDNAPIKDKPDIAKEIKLTESRITINEYRVEALDKLETNVINSEVFDTEINYYIKKELIQPSTFEMGFNFTVNDNWMVRGEYGISGPQHFLMTGVQYRFGGRKTK